jgi:uncharacterized protein DUF6644
MLLEFCQWLQDTAFSTGIRESVWWFPIIETVHLLALAFSVGIIVIVDLRLVGFALRDRPVSEVFGKLQPQAVKGFGINVISGVLLFVSEPVKCYHSTYFLIKCILLCFLALNAWGFDRFTFPTVAGWDKAIVTPFGAKLAGWVSLTFWLGVVVMGRAIAYAGH